ncbi:tRNA 2-thiouridine(34) synthase MnmA [Thermodesulfobacteriota bacterium]
MAQQNEKKQRESDSTKKRFSVGVAMSGGVDSSVTAKLLKNMGHDVHGFFMALAQPDLDQQIKRVKKVAEHLAVPLTVIDLEAEFRETVLDYFTSSYIDGRTPNPCVFCNPKIKFGRLLEEILGTGCDFMATGHYARVIKGTDKAFHLLKGLDPQKDQSYFLHQLTQQQLSRILFPLGVHTKNNVYNMAKDLGISGVHGSESQDVCFLKDKDLKSFMAQHCQEEYEDGFIVTMEDKIIGKHHGIHGYTVGQRRGLGIPDATPYYVVALDPVKNEVVVGKKEDLYRSELSVKDVNWTGGLEPDLPHDFSTRIRYRHAGAPARIMPAEDGVYKVCFQEPQLAVTPGQFAVFYYDDEVLGGGEIL